MTLLEVAFLTVFWSWFLTAILLIRSTWLPRLPLRQQPSVFGMSAETVEFFATDGVRLEGWSLVSELSHPWVILCHGLGSNRADLLEIAAALFARQFNVLLFDFRGHGASRGRTTSFGWTERHDLEGALAFLSQQPAMPSRPVGVYGISLGAAVALMVAGEDERIGAVVADSAYATLEESLHRHLRLLYPWVPPQPFLWYLLLAYRLRFRVWPRHVSPLQACRQLGARRCLFIQGERDSRLLSDTAQRLQAACGGRAEAWVVPSAGHLELLSKDPEGYMGRVVNLLAGGASSPTG